MQQAVGPRIAVQTRTFGLRWYIASRLRQRHPLAFLHKRASLGQPARLWHRARRRLPEMRDPSAIFSETLKARRKARIERSSITETAEAIFVQRRRRRQCHAIQKPNQAEHPPSSVSSYSILTPTLLGSVRSATLLVLLALVITFGSTCTRSSNTVLGVSAVFSACGSKPCSRDTVRINQSQIPVQLASAHLGESHKTSTTVIAYHGSSP